jgi:hypothetical protein
MNSKMSAILVLLLLLLLLFFITILFLLLLSKSLITIITPISAVRIMIADNTNAATIAITMQIIIHFKRRTANRLSLYL